MKTKLNFIELNAQIEILEAVNYVTKNLEQYEEQLTKSKNFARQCYNSSYQHCGKETAKERKRN